MFDWDKAIFRLEELNALSEDPALWQKPEAAQKMLRERNHLAAMVDGYRALDQQSQDSLLLAEMGEEEGDASVVNDAEDTLRAVADKLKAMETEALLSGEVDGNDCFL
ncbi:MAG: PCRF domain-containing protein, partial [Rickettsiales bacterium]|nr:PCRF domain-containing protein [Rickettsiales bacterium]